MKKIILVLFALALLVTACAQQKAVETAAPEAPAGETPAAPVELAAEAQAVPEASAEAPKEEPAQAPAETPKAESDEQLFEVKEGDSFTYKTTFFLVEEIANSGNYMTLYFDPIRFHLYAVNKPEILNGIEYQIVENNFNTKSSVTLRVRPLKLGKDEYLLEKHGSVNVNSKRVMLGEVKTDSKAGDSAYFLVGNNEYWGKLGDNVDAEGLIITLKTAFYRQRQYAIVKIVPK